MKKITIFTMMTLMMTNSLFAQTFIKLPDNFTEKYDSLEAYYKEQAEIKRKAEEAARAALLAKQKAEAAEKGMNSLKASYYSLDKYERYWPESHKKSFGGNLELFSKEPYKEGYVVHSLQNGDTTVWKFSPKNKKLALLEEYEEEYKTFKSNISSYHKIEL